MNTSAALANTVAASRPIGGWRASRVAGSAASWLVLMNSNRLERSGARMLWSPALMSR
jgi:hypothetical protein